MPTNSLDLEVSTQEIRKAGEVVGITDKVYPITAPEVTFDDLEVRGDLTGTLEYNGHLIKIVYIDDFIALEVNRTGPRGPLWKGVRCKVLQ